MPDQGSSSYTTLQLAYSTEEAGSTYSALQVAYQDSLVGSSYVAIQVAWTDDVEDRTGFYPHGSDYYPGINIFYPFDSNWYLE